MVVWPLLPPLCPEMHLKGRKKIFFPQDAVRGRRGGRAKETAKSDGGFAPTHEKRSKVMEGLLRSLKSQPLSHYSGPPCFRMQFGAPLQPPLGPLDLAKTVDFGEQLSFQPATKTSTRQARLDCRGQAAAAGPFPHDQGAARPETAAVAGPLPPLHAVPFPPCAKLVIPDRYKRARSGAHFFSQPRRSRLAART